METATKTLRTLDIDGMTGDACVQKITGSLQGVGGISNQSVKMGCATFNADQAGFDAAHAAVGAAGFKSHERARSGGNAGPEVNAPKADTEHKRATNTAGANAAGPVAPSTSQQGKNEHPVAGTHGKSHTAPAV